MPKIHALPAMTTLAADDVFAADDISTANDDTKKVTATQIKEWLQSLTGWITAAMIIGLDKSLLTTDSNPYKFRAWRNAAANSGNGAFATVVFDTENFDTNSNYSTSTGEYNAPVAGFYQFNANMVLTTSGAELSIISLFVNGTEVSRGTGVTANGSNGSHVSDTLQLAANDKVTARVFNTATRALGVGNSSLVYFSGFLVSRT